MLVGLLVVTSAMAAPAKPPHGAKKIAIEYRWVSFSKDQASYVLEWKGGAYTVGKRTVDVKLVDGLYKALTDLRESDRALQCISHTDDYPSFDVKIDGDEPLALATTSNCHDNAPWNIEWKKKKYAQFSGAAGRALRELLVAADPDKWTSPKGPMASTSDGTAPVLLDKLPGAKAAACVAGVEAALDKVKVKDLALFCDLNDSPDCTATQAAAEVEWSGVQVQIEMPCVGGKVTAPATLGETKQLLASKPVRALVKLSQQPPRMWMAWDAWAVEGDMNLPRLEQKKGTKLFKVWAAGEMGVPGEAFWKELGIDGKKLTKKTDYDVEATATIDFNGKLVP